MTPLPGLLLSALLLPGGEPRRDLNGDPLPSGVRARFGTVRLRHVSAIFAVAWSADGKRIVSGGDNGQLYVWDAADGRLLLDLSRKESRLQVRELACSPDGRWIAAADERGSVHVWDAATGRLLRTLPSGKNSPSRGLAFTPDGNRLIVADAGGWVRVRNPASGDEILAFRCERELTCMALSGDGKTLALGDNDGSIRGTVHLLDAATGRRLRRLGDFDCLHSLAFSPDGKLLAVSALSVALYDTATGNRVRRLEGSPAEGSLSFSPDGSALTGVRGEFDTGVPLWEVATGKRLATTNGWEVRLWDTATGKQVRCLTLRGDSVLSADGRSVFRVGPEE